MSLRFLAGVGPFLIGLALLLLAGALALYRDRAGRGLLLLRLASAAVLVLLLLDPVLSLVDERPRPPRIAVLVDGSLSMTIPSPSPGQTDADKAPTRADRLRDAIEKTNLAQRLEQRGALDVLRFGGDVQPAALDEPETFAPTEDRTDLSRALASAVGGERRSTGAIVLITDGAHNVGADPREESRKLGVPVFTIGVGAETPVTDVSVVEVEASAVAYLENRVPVRARLRARGAAAGAATVYLSEGKAVLDSARVNLPGAGEIEVELEYRPTREGLRRYRVWTPTRSGEISEKNNEHLFVVRVLKEKIELLLVAGRPSFELRFVKRAFESDVSLNVETVILSLDEFPGRLGRGGPKLPASFAQLAKKDVVVLLECDASALRDRAADLARFVRDRGGALLIMGGPASFDLGPPLVELLPARTGRGRVRTGQILAMLTESGRSHPITQLESEPELNTARWAELPPLTVVPIFGPPRADARVLAQGVVDRTARPELALVATCREGKGRVLTIAGAPYWRWDHYLWGTGRSGDVLRKLLSRSVRWLLARDDFQPVLIRPSKHLFEGAESVVLNGQIWDDDYQPIAGADVRATVRGPLGATEEKSREISLVDLGEGRYKGTLPGLPPGDYRIVGQARRGGVAVGADSSEATVAPYRMEFEDPAPDIELLKEIAQESGGSFLPLEKLEELPALLDPKPVVQRKVQELPFLESPWLFLLLLGLLGSEWALRRGRGLP